MTTLAGLRTALCYHAEGYLEVDFCLSSSLQQPASNLQER